MIKFENYPPRVSGDVEWTEEGLAEMQAYIEVQTTNVGNPNMNIVGPTIIKTVAETVASNVEDQDIVSTLGVLNGLLHQLRIPDAHIKEAIQMQLYAPLEAIAMVDGGAR